MKLRKPFAAAAGPPEVRNAWDDWLDGLVQFSVNGQQYIAQTAPGTSREDIPTDFSGYINSIYKRNGPIWALIATRQLIFSEARFQFRDRIGGKAGPMYGTHDLALLEHPWPGGTTGELLSRMEQDVSLAGNFYGVRRIGADGRPKLRRLRPDWVTIIIGVDGEEGDPTSVDSEVIGYLYSPFTRGGIPINKDSDNTEVFLPSEICHYSPYPDPDAQFRGMSWLTPVLREIASDSAATTHKLKFFENGATPNMVVSMKETVGEESFKRLKAIIDNKHQGVQNAYKTLFLGAGADVTVVGNNFEQMSFHVTQGAGESRLAAAAGVPPIIVGFSEGLQSATYSNYGQARRRFADGTLRPLWRMAAASLSTLVNLPNSNTELWYQDSEIAFLQEDEMDRVKIQSENASAIRILIDSGFKPDAVIGAVMDGSLADLQGQHTGLFSVQLQPPGSTLPPINPKPGTPVPDAKTPPADGKTPPVDPKAPPARADNIDLVLEIQHQQELAERDRELERVQAELGAALVDARREMARLKSGRRVVVSRDEDGQISGVDEIYSDGEVDADDAA